MNRDWKATMRSEWGDTSKTGVLERYLVILSHDVQNPLAAAKGAAELLASGEDIGDSTELAALCERNIELASLIVQDVVFLLRAEAGLLQFAPERLDIHGELTSLRDRNATFRDMLGPPEGKQSWVRLDRGNFTKACNALLRLTVSGQPSPPATCKVHPVAGGGELLLSASGVSADSFGASEPPDRQVRIPRFSPNGVPITGLEHIVAQTAADLLGATISCWPTEGGAHVVVRFRSAPAD